MTAKSPAKLYGKLAREVLGDCLMTRILYICQPKCKLPSQ